MEIGNEDYKQLSDSRKVEELCAELLKIFGNADLIADVADAVRQISDKRSELS